MWKRCADQPVSCALAVLALGTLITRLQALALMGWRYVGMDDTVIWNIARDYAHGIFREPYMYGQDYNPMLEALLAAPFIRLGVEPWHVLPVITTLLALLPFWSFAWWHYKRGNTVGALAFAATPLLLPAAWDMSTLITRGLVHGLACMAPVPWLLGRARWGTLAASCCTCIGILCNPNAVVFAAFVYVPVLGERYRRPSFWIGSFLGAMPTLAYWCLARRFFAAHPTDIVHTIDRAEVFFDPALFLHGLGQLDMHFSGSMPVWWPNGWLVIVAIAAMAVLLWRKRQRLIAGGAMLAVALMLFGLGTSKGHNGCWSAFFPLSRLYLGAPLVLAGCAAAAWAGAQNLRQIARAAMLIGIVFASLKCVMFPAAFARQLETQACALSPLRPIAALRERCDQIDQAAQATHAEVVAPIKWPGLRVDPHMHFMAYFDRYACPCLLEKSPAFYGPGYDRMAWVREAWTSRGAPITLFVGGDPAGWSRAMTSHPGIIDRSTSVIQLHTVPASDRDIVPLSVELGADDDAGR